MVPIADDLDSRQLSCAAFKRNTLFGPEIASTKSLVAGSALPNPFNFPVLRKELVIMSGLQTHDIPSSLKLRTAPKDAVVAESETKPKKKICCACPDTKKLRDECIVEHGESACSKWIEAHRLCLRSEGFNV